MSAMILAFLALARAAEPLATVPALDLERYQGTWFELARLDVSFERGCEGVTATYGLREDGKVDVTNSCRKGSLEGREKVAHGIARVPDPAAPGRIRVSFFRPFWGDYQVIALEPDYRWAVVGAPSRRYLWILSRTPTLDPATWETALGAARDRGFDVDALRRTLQPAAR